MSISEIKKKELSAMDWWQGYLNSYTKEAQISRLHAQFIEDLVGIYDSAVDEVEVFHRVEKRLLRLLNAREGVYMSAQNEQKEAK